MKRILIRTGKRPGTYVNAEATHGYRGRGVIAQNPGNYFYWDSTFRMVSVPGIEVVPDSLLSASGGAADEYYDRINNDFDAYVFTLTNSFRADFVTGLHRWARMIDRLRIPVIGVGGGVQLGWKDGLEPGEAVDKATKRFLRSLLNHSASVSVRGETTAAYLKRLGFGDEHVHVTGCPSMYLYGPDYKVEPKGELTTDSKVGITIATRDYGFAKFANRAFDEYPNIMFIGQNMGDLDMFLWGTERWVDTRPGIPANLDHPYIREGKARMFLDARTWVDFLRDYQYMMGTRIHGNVAALLAGTPATLISMDQRTHELGEFHEIPTIRRPDMKPDDTIASVYERSDWTAFNNGLQGRYENLCRFFEANGLEHIGQPGKANPAYDEALAKAKLPPPVEPIMTHDQIDPRALLERLQWLREGIDETEICEVKGYFVPEFPLITKDASTKNAKTLEKAAEGPSFREEAVEVLRGIRKLGARAARGVKDRISR